MKGRKPVPEALNALHGNPDGHRRPRETPQPGALDEPPAWMTEDQKEVWRYIIRHAAKDLLRSLDRGLLSAYCVAEDAHAKAAAMLNRDGDMMKPDALSRFMSIMTRQAQLLIRCAQELGFTPVSRTRVYMRGGAETGERVVPVEGSDLKQYIASAPQPPTVN